MASLLDATFLITFVVGSHETEDKFLCFDEFTDIGNSREQLIKLFIPPPVLINIKYNANK